MKFDKLQVSASLTFLTCSAALGLSWLYSHRELNQLGSQVLPFSPEATLLHRPKIVLRFGIHSNQAVFSPIPLCSANRHNAGGGGAGDNRGGDVGSYCSPRQI